MQYRYQFASDVVRDGMRLELTDESWHVLAEVFRCDAKHSLTITLFFEGLPFTEIEKLVSIARKELGPFEDGTPFPEQLELNN